MFKVKRYQPALWRGCSRGLDIAALRRWCETWAADTGTSENGTLASRADGGKSKTHERHAELQISLPQNVESNVVSPGTETSLSNSLMIIEFCPHLAQ